MNSGGTFNIRVYGLLTNTQNEILLSDEYVLSTYMTKFPGGGLEYGEGTLDCLKREFREELAIDIKIENHFYTTDFFQSAVFFDNTQLISIYYLVSSPEVSKIITTDTPFNFAEKEGSQAFRWVAIKDLTTQEVTFPIDKIVIQKLKEQFIPFTNQNGITSPPQ